MLHLALPTIGVPTLDISNLILNHPALVQHIGGDALAHVLYSYVRRAGHKRRHSRRHARKILNRKRRWFVDNIIMHHRRLHERNRELVVTNARSRVLAKREAERRRAGEGPNQERDESKKWQDADAVKNRTGEIRGRIDARKMRARSRWVSVAGKREDKK